MANTNDLAPFMLRMNEINRELETFKSKTNDPLISRQQLIEIHERQHILIDEMGRINDEIGWIRSMRESIARYERGMKLLNRYRRQ